MHFQTIFERDLTLRSDLYICIPVDHKRLILTFLVQQLAKIQRVKLHLKLTCKHFHSHTLCCFLLFDNIRNAHKPACGMQFRHEYFSLLEIFKIKPLIVIHLQNLKLCINSYKSFQYLSICTYLSNPSKLPYNFIGKMNKLYLIRYSIVLSTFKFRVNL